MCVVVFEEGTAFRTSIFIAFIDYESTVFIIKFEL